MKKSDFLDLVCAALAQMGVEDSEIGIQRQNIDRYLKSMGVGEESPALDGENPSAFAKLIYGNIVKKHSGADNSASSATKETPSATEETPSATEDPEFSDEMPNVEVVEGETVEVPAEIPVETPAETFVEVPVESVTTDASIEIPVQTVPAEPSIEIPAQTVPTEFPIEMTEAAETFVEIPVQTTSIEAPAVDEEDDIKIFEGSHVEARPIFDDISVPIQEDPVLEDIFDKNDPVAANDDFDVSEYAPAGTFQDDLYTDTYGNSVSYAEFDSEEIISEDSPYYEEDYSVSPANTTGTIEFDVSEIKKKTVKPQAGQLEEEEDYFEKNDDEDYAPSGNPALFWVLVALTSFLWIPLFLLLFVFIALAFVLMLIFEVAHVPAIVAVIVGGSAISFAELIYSIVKFVGKNPSVAMFELGLGLLVAALTFGLPTILYYLGVSVFPGCIKNYGKNVKKLFKKLRRVYRKLKGVCSI